MVKTAESDLNNSLASPTAGWEGDFCVHPGVEQTVHTQTHTDTQTHTHALPLFYCKTD